MATLAKTKREEKQEIEKVLEKAVDFHGHLGPFLVLGVRMGLTGLRELGTRKGDPKLRITATTKPSVPFSCLIDGIQSATQCTVGNRKLKLNSSRESISAKFQIPEGNALTITLNPIKKEELERLLSKHGSVREIEKIARKVVSMPEMELFKIN